MKTRTRVIGTGRRPSWPIWPGPVGLVSGPLPLSLPIDDAHPATAHASTSAVTFGEYRNVRISGGHGKVVPRANAGWRAKSTSPFLGTPNSRHRNGGVESRLFRGWSNVEGGCADGIDTP